MAYPIYPAIAALDQSEFGNHSAWSWASEGALSPPYLLPSGYWDIVDEFVVQVFSYRYISLTHQWYTVAFTYEGTREFFEGDFILPSAADFVNEVWSPEYPQYLRLHSARGTSYDYWCAAVSPAINAQYHYSSETWAGWMPIKGTYDLYPAYYPAGDPNYRNFRIEYAGINFYQHYWAIYVDGDDGWLGWVFWRRPEPPQTQRRVPSLLPILTGLAALALPLLAAIPPTSAISATSATSARHPRKR